MLPLDQMLHSQFDEPISNEMLWTYLLLHVASD